MTMSEPPPLGNIIDYLYNHMSAEKKVLEAFHSIQLLI